MNNKLLLSRSVAKIAIVLVAVVAILVTLTFTAPYRAFADDNYEPNVDLTENAEVPNPGDLTLEAPGNASDGDSEDPAPVDGVVAPGTENLDSAPNNSGAETVELPLGEDRAPDPQQRGESRQAPQRGFNTWHQPRKWSTGDNDPAAEAEAPGSKGRIAGVHASHHYERYCSFGTPGG